MSVQLHSVSACLRTGSVSAEAYRERYLAWRTGAAEGARYDLTHQAPWRYVGGQHGPQLDLYRCHLQQLATLSNISEAAKHDRFWGVRPVELGP